MNTTVNLSFDIGHSSIGWAVFDANHYNPDDVQLLGCGVVLFEKDSALANVRRRNRQQRRHVRATRQRIEYIRRLFLGLHLMTEVEMAETHGQGKGHSAPWLLAARVLASRGEKLLTWAELWAVLRWYAHNRGYEPFGDAPEESAKEDTEKVENAKKRWGNMGRKLWPKPYASGFNSIRLRPSSIAIMMSAIYVVKTPPFLGQLLRLKSDRYLPVM